MNIKKISAVFILIFVFCILHGEGKTVNTPAEKVNFTQYSQYEEITQFLSLVDNMSKEMSVVIVGRTLETKDYGSKDLYLCILTEEGIDCPEKLNRNKPTFYLVAAKHGNEQSAKEAALCLIRDLAVGELKPLLKKMNFLIISQANPYGNFLNQRRNEQNLDLNRDQVKLEAPEAEVINLVFRTWMPEVTMDVHEKGDDYYRVNIGCVSNINIHSDIQKFSRNPILQEVEKNLKKKGITFHEYLVTQEMGIDSSAGVNYSREDTGKRETMKRFSTTDLNDGRNSPGIYETLSFIQEGASRHDLKTLKERTRWQYFGIRFFSESIARHGIEINSMVRGLRKNLIDKARIYSESDLVHLRMKYVRDEKEPTITIKKFERIQTNVRGVLKVDKKAGDALFLSDIIPYQYPSSYKVVEETIENWFPNVEPLISVSRPLGYIIPSGHLDVVETLLRHGLRVETFVNDISVEVEAYKFLDVIPAKYDYLPPEKIEVEKKVLKTIIKRGDYYVTCAQDGASLIPSLLEPQSQYGFIRYWKFKLVPEKGDFFAILRFVKKVDLPVILYKRWKR